MDEHPTDWTFPRDTGVYLCAPRRLAAVRLSARLATFSCIAPDAEVMVAFEKVVVSFDAFPGIGVCETINLRDWNLARTMFALGVLTERGMIAPEAP
jgi:hypothetical protein